MHRITTPYPPVEVETIVSGTSTPSSIGQVLIDDALFARLADPASDLPNPDDRRLALQRELGCASVTPPDEEGGHRFVKDEQVEVEDAQAGFLVEWVNPAGQERFCGKASGGISAESVVHLIQTLSRNGRANTFTVTRTR